MLIIAYNNFTHVPDVQPNSLSLNQGGDPETIVPVATTEQQFPIMGDHKQCCRDVDAWGKGFGQKTLGSAWQWVEKSTERKQSW